MLNDFEAYLKQHVKVDNKAGNLGSAVSITKDSNQIVVQASIPFSKRYLKYLTKKYLKKQELKEYLRVVATQKNQYELRYFNIQSDEANEWAADQGLGYHKPRWEEEDRGGQRDLSFNF